MEAETVHGLVATLQDTPVMLKEVVPPDPGPEDTVVRILTCGVCHIGLHYRDGDVNDDFPFLPGHEAAGTVERIGNVVTDASPGDSVVLNWRAVCGTCRARGWGELQCCLATFNASRPMTPTDGTELTSALGVGTFVEKTLIHPGQRIKVDPEAHPVAVGLLGCSVMAGLGVAVNTENVRRSESVAVIGCGGVGYTTVVDAALASTGRVTTVDRGERKLCWVRDLGVTDTVDSRKQNLVMAIRVLTEGFGVDAVIDAVSLPEIWEQTFCARNLAGTVVLVGVLTSDEKVSRISLFDVFSRGSSLKSSWYEDCLPSRNPPMLANLYRQGRLDLGALVSEEITLDEVERTFGRMKQGEVLRSMVVL